MIASYLSNYAADLTSQVANSENSSRIQHFADEARRLRNRALEMVRGGHISWWFDALDDTSETDSNEGTLADTADSIPPSDTAGKDAGKMTYLCDGNLGEPQPVDCEKLSWSGLKAPDVIETLKPETPAVYTSGTCAFGVSSPVALSISWAHLLTAFETINTLCVQSPMKTVKGGRAYFGAQSVDSWINGKRDSVGGVNGSEALPPGVNVTVWKHGIVRNVDPVCEWQLAMNGKDIRQCEKG